MKTIVIASQNPIKARATLGGFERMFPGEAFRVQSISVASGVGQQPLSSEETLRGAHLRVQAAAEQIRDADYWVGIEGGIESTSDGMMAFAWVVVRSSALTGRGRTGSFPLPQEVADLIREGKELGEANDIVFHRENSKRQEGAVGLLTENVIDRRELYEHAIILALIPFKNVDMYRHPTGLE